MFHSELRDAIRDKLPMEDTMDDQSILDMHVKRVWQDHTPNRSPGTASPGPLAAVRSRRTNEFVLQLNYGAAGSVGGGSEMKYGDGNSSNNSIISGSGGQSQSMRHSRSMDGQQQMSQQQQRSKTLTNKWPSMQTDSGISLFSGDTLIKKDQRWGWRRSGCGTRILIVFFILQFTETHVDGRGWFVHDNGIAVGGGSSSARG